jgi:hypothetical protein
LGFAFWHVRRDCMRLAALSVVLNRFNDGSPTSCPLLFWLASVSSHVSP